jgi:hypothetical protein
VPQQPAETGHIGSHRDFAKPTALSLLDAACQWSGFGWNSARHWGVVTGRYTKQATTEPCGFGGRLEVTSVDGVQPIDNAYVDRCTTSTEG